MESLENLLPNLESQIQIVEGDVQDVMDSHPLFKVMVENKALRRIINSQSQRIKELEFQIEKFREGKINTVLTSENEIPKNKVK
jgi:hypothetical protein